MQVMRNSGDTPTALELQSADMSERCPRGLHRHRQRDDLRHQLDRASKEIEELKGWLATESNKYLAARGECERLRAEVQELKLVNEQALKLLKDRGDMCGELAATYKGLSSSQDKTDSELQLLRLKLSPYDPEKPQ